MPEKKQSKFASTYKGQKNPMWKGGSKSTDALNARKAWEQHWGKKIPAGYIIAHKDGNPTNNSIRNLSMLTIAEHNKRTKAGKTLAQQAKGVKNKPNIGGATGVQRRFR